jgi:hypothetical protein
MCAYMVDKNLVFRDKSTGEILLFDKTGFWEFDGLNHELLNWNFNWKNKKQYNYMFYLLIFSNVLTITIKNFYHSRYKSQIKW